MGVEHRGSRKMGFLLGDYEEEVVVVGSTQCALPSTGSTVCSLSYKTAIIVLTKKNQLEGLEFAKQ